MTQNSVGRIGFVLTPGYALMSLATAVEPLRAANHLAGRMLYHCTFYSSSGGFMASTSGGGFDTEPVAAMADGNLDLALVVAGGNPMLYEDPVLERGLRRLTKRGVRLGGISGGAAILAKAGLMAGRRFTLHWAHVDALREHDPDLLIERALYVIDRDRYSCAGGIAAMDMMGALITREQGAAFAREVSEWFIHPRLRTADEPQRSSMMQRFGLRHPVLESAVELMESHLADPLSPQQLAALTGMSVRQLQRLFFSQFGMPMMRFYRDLRLAKADELLQQSMLSVTAISLAVGFSGVAHFTRCFTDRYDIPPARRRRSSGSAKA